MNKNGLRTKLSGKMYIKNEPVLRIRDVYPVSRTLIFYPSRIPDAGSRIPDPKTAAKERGEKMCCYSFFVAKNFT
jgi:hypothetical protein